MGWFSGGGFGLGSIGGLGDLFSGNGLGGSGSMAGGGGPSQKQMKDQSGRFWGNFDQLMYSLENDPMAWRQRKNIERFMDTNPDMMGMARSGAMRGADTQSSGLINALAARGGGSLQSALTMGAQGRVGAELQGLQAGTAMQGERSNLIGDLINQYLGGKYGTSASMLSSGASFGGQMVGAQSRYGAAQVGANAQVVSSMMGAMSG